MPSDPLSAVFAALASETRRRILDVLMQSPGCNVRHVASHFDTSRIAVQKHLAVLEGAGLVTSLKAGRERRLYFNAVPIQEIHERWTTEYSALWAARMTDINRRVEAREKGRR